MTGAQCPARRSLRAGQGFCFGILWDKRDGKKDLQDVLFKKYKNLSEKLAK